jgi:hypothetical protein
MFHFTDPATGRAYEVGPDGTPRWLDESADTTAKRTWYRRPGVIAAATGVGGLLIGTALGGGGSSAAPTATGPTGTTTTTVTASAVPPSAVTTTQTVQATVKTTRTITATSKPRTVTVTRTAAAQTFAGGGGSGGAVYYGNCTEARAAGDTPLYRGDPGYRAALDRDDDGVACE